MPSSMRASSIPCRSAPTARSPMPTAMSRSCRATGFRRSRATGSRLASIIRSPTPSRSAATRCSSAASILPAMNPTRRRGCRVFGFQRPRLVSDQQDVPDLRPRRQYLRQSLCDLRDVLRYRGRTQFRQWRRAVHRPSLGQPGAAARLLCGAKGDLLAPEWVSCYASESCGNARADQLAGTLYVVRKRPATDRRSAPCGWRMERTQNASGTRG